MSTWSRLTAKDRIGFCSTSSSSMAALMQVVPDVLSARTDIRADLSGVAFSICWGPVVAVISLPGEVRCLSFRKPHERKCSACRPRPLRKGVRHVQEGVCCQAAAKLHLRGARSCRGGSGSCRCSMPRALSTGRPGSSGRGPRAQSPVTGSRPTTSARDRSGGIAWAGGSRPSRSWRAWWVLQYLIQGPPSPGSIPSPASSSGNTGRPPHSKIGPGKTGPRGAWTSTAAVSTTPERSTATSSTGASAVDRGLTHQ